MIDRLSPESIKARWDRYKEIRDTHKVKYEYIGSGYSHDKYKILENPDNLCDIDLALICDDGNVCFDYRMEGNVVIVYTD